MEPVVNAAGDPVVVRRTRIARAVSVAKRVGYGALLAAIAAFFGGLASGWPAWSVTATIAGLVVATVVLPVPIVLGYGIRAAEREDRARRGSSRPAGAP
jgi:hypothetical protein